jgi:CheY-like chemotaxis protein
MPNIMIVDDEALVLFDLTLTVEDLGHEVFCDSTNIDEALAALEDGCPDAALLDIDVGGTPVWPLARTLKSKGCPIVFVSANSRHEELRTEFADCHVVDKPASQQDIARALAIVGADPVNQPATA